MTFKMLPRLDGESQIFARIDDDGKCRYSCTAQDLSYLQWLAEGNTPEPADAPTGGV